MKGWRGWFDSGDGLELTATFIMCLPFLVLVTPPLLASQLPESYFYPVSLLGWVLLPGLTWLTAAPGRGKPGFGSLLLWLGMSYSACPLLIFVSWLFWDRHDYLWCLGLMLVSLFLAWQSADRVRQAASISKSPAG